MYDNNMSEIPSDAAQATDVSDKGCKQGTDRPNEE